MQCVVNAKIQFLFLQKYSIIFIYEHKDITWVSRHMKWKSRQLSRQFSVSFVNSHGFVLAPHTSQLTMRPALQRAHAYCFQMSCISPTFSFVFLCFTFSYFNLGWFVTQFCWAWHVDGDHLVTKAEMGLSWLPPWCNSSTCCTIFNYVLSVCTTCIDLHPHVSWSHWPYLRFCLCASEASPHFASSDKPRDARRWERMGLNIHIL